MKAVLAVLLSFVFIQTQTFALSGGPNYPGATGSFAGTYAGTFVPTVGSNALGVFVLGVPLKDIAEGVSYAFSEGSFYQGGMVGIVDPDQATFNGLLKLVRLSSVSTAGSGTLSFSFDATADGFITMDFDTATPDDRLSGTAHTEVKEFDFTTGKFVPAGTLDFSVDGFRQSLEIVKPTNAIVTLLLNGSTGG